MNHLASSSRGNWLVAGFLLVLALAFQGSRPLFDPDEGRYTAVALQMLESGNWLMPQFNVYQDHLTKPPMTYWALATSMALFGQNEWAARLPNALAFWLTGLLVLLLGRRFVPDRPWLPVLIWGSGVVTALGANVINTDTLLALFETAAMLAWLRSRDADASVVRWRMVMWVAFGLAFFTKGPPALLPLLPIVVISALEGGWRQALAPFDWRGLLIFLVLGGWWFVVLMQQRPELIEYFFGYELRDRLLSDVHKRNSEWYGAFKIYLPILALMLLPWICLRIGWISGIWRGRQLSWWRQCWKTDRERIVLLLWILLPLAIFFLARSRLYLYLLPLAVPMALLIARDLLPRIPAPMPRRWIIGLSVCAAVILVLKGFSSTLTGSKDASRFATQIRQLAPDAERLLFSDVTARYGLRFYLHVPVQQVGRTHSNSPLARVQTENVLCDQVRAYPSALVITRGTAMGKRMLPEARPECPGIVFQTLQPDSGLWRVDWAQSQLQPADSRPR